MLIEGGAGALALTPYLGLAFDPRPMDAILAGLARARAEDRYSYVVTPNVDHLIRLHAEHGDPGERARIWAAYRGADLCLCDSRILTRLAGLQGVTLATVPGSDLTAMLLRDVAAPGDRIAIVGGDAAMVASLERRFPGIAFVQHVPPMGLRGDPAAMRTAADFMRASDARFILLAVGSPQQELLAALVAQEEGARGTALCIGASLDFLTGRQRRAPRWMQQLSLEWAYRLLSSPRRMWRRYLIEGPRIFLIALRAGKPRP